DLRGPDPDGNGGRGGPGARTPGDGAIHERLGVDAHEEQHDGREQGATDAELPVARPGDDPEDDPGDEAQDRVVAQPGRSRLPRPTPFPLDDIHQCSPLLLPARRLRPSAYYRSM